MCAFVSVVYVNVYVPVDTHACTCVCGASGALRHHRPLCSLCERGVFFQLGWQPAVSAHVSARIAGRRRTIHGLLCECRVLNSGPHTDHNGLGSYYTAKDNFELVILVILLPSPPENTAQLLVVCGARERVRPALCPLSTELYP